MPTLRKLTYSLTTTSFFAAAHACRQKQNGHRLGCGAGALLDPVFLSLLKIKGSFLSFLVILLGVCVTFFGSCSYVVLFPIIALLYKKIGRSPILGILTVFLGMTLGYGTGIMFNYDSYVLGS